MKGPKPTPENNEFLRELEKALRAASAAQPRPESEVVPHTPEGSPSTKDKTEAPSVAVAGGAATMAEAARALADAVKALKFSAYPAHGSGFVTIVQGNLGAVMDAERALRAALKAQPQPSMVHYGVDYSWERGGGNSQSVAGGAAPLSENIWTEEDIAAADKKATELHRHFHPEKYAMSETDARRLAEQGLREIKYTTDWIDVTARLIIKQNDAAQARIAELERERDAISKIEAIQAGHIETLMAERDAWKAEAKRYCERGDALQAQLARIATGIAKGSVDVGEASLLVLEALRAIND